MPNSRIYIKTILKTLVSMVLIYFVFRMIHVGLVFEIFKQMKAKIVCFILFIYVIYLFVGALKWKILLPEYSFITLLRFTTIGQLYGLILPGQITGELAKGYRFAREGGNGDGARITASIFVDKISSFGALVILGIIGSLFATFHPPFFAWVVILGFGLLLIGFIYVARFKRFFINLFLKCKIPEKIVLKLDLFLAHYNAFSASRTALCLSVIMGMVSQGIAVVMNIIIAQSIGVNIGGFEWLWLFAITSFVILLPITIGGLGIRETVFAASALSLNVRPTLTVAVSLIMYTFQVIFACIGGLIELRSFMKKKNV
jgi:glycosyltransferase 2 family protein